MIPSDATGVVIYSEAFAPLPYASMIKDRDLELRFILPPPSAQALRDKARLDSASLKNPNDSALNMMDHLRTADDMNPVTPLPAGFESFLLANPSATSACCVSVNVQTGEVVYWIFEM